MRLVGENIPEQGIYPIAKARAMAEELELDLVEISAKADPPVCKILDYQKYLYQQKKKAKEMPLRRQKLSLKKRRSKRRMPKLPRARLQSRLRSKP